MKLKLVIGLILVLVLLAGCAQTVEQVKKEENVGKTVSVSGTAQGVIKIGQLSGYTLVDKNGDKIGVSSESLPAEGSAVTAKGVLMKDTLLGYYIKVS
jgi:hypothetical protein